LFGSKKQRRASSSCQAPPDPTAKADVKESKEVSRT
jgi:hypothetical protein